MNLLLLCLFIAGQGFFAGMETGIVSVRRPRIEHAAVSGSRKAKLLLFFLDRPGVMISTTLLGVNICVVGASLAAKAFSEEMGFRSPEALLVCTSCLSILMLTCEIIPKNWFRQSPDSRCSFFIIFLYLTYLVLFIPVRLFEVFTGFLERKMKGPNTGSLQTALMREDLRLYIRESETDGELSSEAASMLDHAVMFHDRTLREIMVPFESGAKVSTRDTVAAAAAVCRKKGFLHLPVVSSRNPEKCVSIFSYYDALYEIPEEKWHRRNVLSCSEEIAILAPDMSLSEAFNAARLSPASMFLVGENGKIVGLVTRSMMINLLF